MDQINPEKEVYTYSMCRSIPTGICYMPEYHFLSEYEYKKIGIEKIMI